MSVTKIGPAPSINARAAHSTATLSIAAAGGIVDWGASVAFRKRADDSHLLVFLRSSGYPSLATGRGQYYLQLGSTDYTIGVRHGTLANSHVSLSTDSTIVGVPAGSYTAQLRASCPSAGVWHAAGDDTQSFMVMEVGGQNPPGATGPRLRGIAATKYPSSGTLTSTSYVNAGLSKSFTKLQDETRLIFMITCSAFNSGFATHWGLNIDSADTDCAFRWINEAATHKTFCGFNERTGVDAGTYTVNLRHKVTGSTLAWDANDTWSFMVLEVP